LAHKNFLCIHIGQVGRVCGGADDEPCCIAQELDPLEAILRHLVGQTYDTIVALEESKKTLGLRN